MPDPQPSPALSQRQQKSQSSINPDWLVAAGWWHRTPQCEQPGLCTKKTPLQGALTACQQSPCSAADWEALGIVMALGVDERICSF